MAWIELHQSLFTHRKTMQAAETLDLPEVYVVAHLMALWTWALDNAPDGVLPTSRRIIGKAAQWSGDPTALVNALFDAGFLEGDEEGRTLIHDWHSYAGRLVEKREANAERMRRARATSNPAPVKAPEEARAESVQRTCVARAGATVPNSTVPYPTEQNTEQESAPVRAKRTQKPAPVFLSPPSLVEIKQFCLGQGWPELAEEAHDYQTQRGWMMKNGPVIDWPAALRNWKRTRDRYAAEDGARLPFRSSPQHELDLSPEARRARIFAAIP